jgi:excisionase family DNA binding protein
MLFFQFIMTFVLWGQIRSRRLWGRWLNDVQVNQLSRLLVITLLVSIGALVVPLILMKVAPQFLDSLGELAITVPWVVTLVSFIVSFGGVYWIYFQASKEPQQIRRLTRYISLEDAADLLDISDKELLALVENGNLRARKLDGEYRFDPKLLKAYQEAQS